MFEQDRMLMRLQQRVNGERPITACFLSGSYGRRREDAYSDMDVALVYGSEAERDMAWRRRQEFVQSMMPYVAVKSFDGVHVRPYFHIALYSNGSKVDYRFETRDGLQPNPWDRDIRILKDSDGWAEQFQQDSQRLALPQPHITADELTALDTRFWVMYWDVLRLLLRGDYQKPFPIYLELLHFTLPPLLRALPLEDAAHQALLHAQFSHDTKATARHMQQLLTAYLGARTAVTQRHQLTFIPDRAFENNMQNLIKRIT
ncbi:MAG: hypothetical protein H6662_02090 [Ardenticatenaceae bacterium]|nr:hypothetical protein [Anaerolineales bacterium]MCB8920350.1 hypothetical protein [Ardenticatenaceae bacterium]MCB8989305.1 hypothetical protein [Ardenticatenaceae bacterium]